MPSVRPPIPAATPLRRHWVWLGGLTLTLLALAACTSSGSERPGSSSDPSSGRTTSPAASPMPGSARSGRTAAVTSNAPAPLVLPTHIPNNAALRKNVRITSCRAGDGGWTVKGTAENPGSKPVTYHLMVFFSTTSATTLAVAQTEVTVSAGKTANWSMSKQFTGDKKMNCTLVGVA